MGHGRARGRRRGRRVVVVEAPEAPPMKGWFQSVALPTIEAALTASVPLSTAWLLYQATPRWGSSSDEVKSEASRVREESTSAITATVLTVLATAGTALYFLGGRGSR